jgi:hypothetical protein
MSIEKLNTAARAAGFAMAGPDELSEESKPAVQAEPEAEGWRAGAAVLSVQEKLQDTPKPTATEWVKSLFALGRGAPA